MMSSLKENNVTAVLVHGAWADGARDFGQVAVLSQSQGLANSSQ
jgi:hypothetical protein